MIKVIALGNLTRTPTARAAGSGSVVEFGIASNRKYTTAAGEKREDVCFLDCEAWGKTGENIGKFFIKGNQIVVIGRLAQQTWEAKDGSGKRSKHILTVEEFQFTAGGTGGRETGDADEPRGHSHRGSAERTPKRELAEQGLRVGGKPQSEPAERPFDEEKVFEEADIPF